MKIFFPKYHKLSKHIRPSYHDFYLQLNSHETGRRQRFRPIRRRPIAQRRKESNEFDKDSTIYDYVDPLTFSDVYGSPSTAIIQKERTYLLGLEVITRLYQKYRFSTFYFIFHK